MRFAFADPPYLGCGALYADDHHDARSHGQPLSLIQKREGVSRSCLSATKRQLKAIKMANWQRRLALPMPKTPSTL